MPLILYTWFSRFLFPPSTLCHNIIVTFCQFCIIFYTIPVTSQWNNGIILYTLYFILLFFFIDKRWLLKPLPYETFCGILSLSKFVMFTFVVSYTICLIVFFPLTEGGNKIFGFFMREQKREIFIGRGNEPPWSEIMVRR